MGQGQVRELHSVIDNSSTSAHRVSSSAFGVKNTLFWSSIGVIVCPRLRLAERHLQPLGQSQVREIRRLQLLFIVVGSSGVILIICAKFYLSALRGVHFSLSSLSTIRGTCRRHSFSAAAFAAGFATSFIKAAGFVMGSQQQQVSPRALNQRLRNGSMLRHEL